MSQYYKNIYEDNSFDIMLDFIHFPAFSSYSKQGVCVQITPTLHLHTFKLLSFTVFNLLLFSTFLLKGSPFI